MNLYEIRILHHKTQKQVAADVGVSAKTYNNYENGNTQPDFATLIKLADYFKVSVDYLLGHSIEQKLDLTTLTEDQKDVVNLTQMLNSDNCKLLLAYANGLAEGQKQHAKKIKEILNNVE